MGLDAIVYCNCYHEGRATPPPVPRDQIEVAEDGWYSLTLPNERDLETWLQFDSWMYTACEHPNMEYAGVRVSNWDGYRSFQAAVERVGWTHFPTLHTWLPNLNGGMMPAAAAATALLELASFRRLPDVGQEVVLIDVVSGDVMQAHHSDAYPIFMWVGGDSLRLLMGIDNGGFFITLMPPEHSGAATDSGTPELFRAWRFRQRLSDDAVEYTDLDTGRRFVCATGLSKDVPCPDGDAGRSCHEYPAAMRVETRTISGANYAYAIDALEEICQAAVETGNPVLWC